MRQDQLTAVGSLKRVLRMGGYWLSAAHCGPRLAGRDGGATIAATSEDFRECDHHFLKHIQAKRCVVKESEIEDGARDTVQKGVKFKVAWRVTHRRSQQGGSRLRKARRLLLGKQTHFQLGLALQRKLLRIHLQCVGLRIEEMEFPSVAVNAFMTYRGCSGRSANPIRRSSKLC